MKQKTPVMRAKLTLLAVLLVVFVTTFATEATAMSAKNPKWVSTRWSATIVRNSDNKVPKTSPNYWQLRINITHTNNSEDRDIINIYEKQVRFNAACSYETGRLPRVKQNEGNSVSGRGEYRINTEVELWPGMSYDLGYRLNLGSFIQPYYDNDTREWEWLNDAVGKLLNEKGNGASVMFKNMKVVYEYNIRSRPTASYEERRRPRG